MRNEETCAYGCVLVSLLTHLNMKRYWSTSEFFIPVHQNYSFAAGFLLLLLNLKETSVPSSDVYKFPLFKHGNDLFANFNAKWLVSLETASIYTFEPCYWCRIQIIGIFSFSFLGRGNNQGFTQGSSKCSSNVCFF